MKRTTTYAIAAAAFLALVLVAPQITRGWLSTLPEAQGLSSRTIGTASMSIVRSRPETNALRRSNR